MGCMELNMYKQEDLEVYQIKKKPKQGESCCTHSKKFQIDETHNSSMLFWAKVACTK